MVVFGFFVFLPLTNFTYLLDVDMGNFSDILMCYKLEMTLLFTDSTKSQCELHEENRRVWQVIKVSIYIQTKFK